MLKVIVFMKLFQCKNDLLYPVSVEIYCQNEKNTFKQKKKRNKKPHLYHVIMTDGNTCPRKSGGFPCLPLFYNFFNEWDHTTQYNLLQNMQPNGSEHLKKKL